jgi:hypothetical protein
VSFLTRTSVLEGCAGRCATRCSAPRGGHDAGVLRAVQPAAGRAGPAGEWYRYHHLLSDLPAAELRRREPEIAPRLHLVAAAWHEGNGLPELAIDHAQAAGDTDRVARLVLNEMQPVWASGRVDTVLRWMEWFEHENLIERSPGGGRPRRVDLRPARPAKAERWAAAAERAPSEGMLPDGSTMVSYLAYLRTPKASPTARRSSAPTDLVCWGSGLAGPAALQFAAGWRRCRGRRPAARGRARSRRPHQAGPEALADLLAVAPGRRGRGSPLPDDALGSGRPQTHPYGPAD